MDTLLPPLLFAIADIHRKRILHLDLKPGNVMVTPEGQTVLIDFGSAFPFDNYREAGHV